MNNTHGDSDWGEKSRPRLVWLIPLFFAVVILSLGLLLPRTVTQAAESRPEQASLTARLQGVPDLTISKSHQGDFVINLDPQAFYTYTIQVSNVGTALVSGPITVTDVLSDALEPVGGIGQGWAVGFNGQTFTCVYSNTVGVSPTVSLPSLRLFVRIKQTNTTSVINRAVVSNISDANPANNVAVDPTTLVGADLAVSKSVTPSSPSPGSIITYTVTLSNQGPSQATGVVLTDTLPAGISYRSASATQGGYTQANGRWDVGTLNNGSSAVLRISATVDAASLGKTITNAIEGLRSTVPDYNLSNNTASVSFSVQTTRVSGIVTDAAKDTPLSGVKVELQDSANHLYSLNTTATGWFTFTNTITTPLASGNATIRASKTGYATKSANIVIVPNQSLRQDLSLDTADLLITKSDGLTTVIPGSTITYTLVISNLGTIPASTVVITDVLPTFTTYITDTSGIAHTVPAAYTYVWKINNNIDPGKAFRFKIRARVADALPSPTHTLTNRGSVSSQTPDSNPDNNVALDNTTSTGTPNPTLTLAVTPNQVRTGQNATYTIKLINAGTAPMTDVEVSDTFSTFLDISSARTTKGTAAVNNTTRRVTVAIDVVAPNSEVTITVVARVNTSATTNTTVSNVATVTYKFGGSNFSRNSNTVSFQILVSSTLPGTGGIELDAQDAPARHYLLAFFSSILLLGLGISAFVYYLKNRNLRSEWSVWALKMGLLLTVAAGLFAGAGVVLSGITSRGETRLASLQSHTGQGLEKIVPESTHAPDELILPGALLQIPGSELDKLPDFPIPTPTIHPEIAQENDIDISPVNRIIIPALALDTVVRYVPYDGLTWMIAGLQQEIAWMGETSWPGMGSNTALAGHVTLRDGRNGPFRDLSDLRSGDAIFVYTEKNIYEYTVNDLVTVEPTDLSVVEPTDDPTLTLITCSDWDRYTGFYTKRLVVKSTLVSSKPITQISQGN